jgi:sulfur-oxidizing protein SoxY
LLHGLLASLLSVAASALLFRPRRAGAAEWPKDAFLAKTVDEALRHLYGSEKPTLSPQVRLHAPFVAADSARVPVRVTTTLPDVQSISLLVDKNARPLAVHLTPRVELVSFSVDLQIKTTSEVRCVVKAGDKLYSAKQTIKVAASA